MKASYFKLQTFCNDITDTYIYKIEIKNEIYFFEQKIALSLKIMQNSYIALKFFHGYFKKGFVADFKMI